MSENRVCRLFNISYPIIQAGMIWCSGWELASAVSEAGGLGIIGAGSMYPDVLAGHIKRCREATSKPFAVNLPLLYPQIEDHLNLIIENRVPIVFTSAGNPAKYTSTFKEQGITVVHVVSSAAFAQKAERAGVDAVVAEGFEAGGHNGREETTTLCLIPQVRKATLLPLIAAGGIGSGTALYAVMALGADGAQLGSRFVATHESSAHPSFKEAVVRAGEGDTRLSLKALTPVRLLKNPFFDQVVAAEGAGADVGQLTALLGRGRAKRGMFEGDLIEGELEIGQVSAGIDEILPAAEVVRRVWDEFQQTKASMSRLG
ncbi:MAG: nitronate monooxygenase [Sphingomonadales bacterium]|nr:nitronate monooxygenase [Sphingomonadales bacterium]